MFDDICLRAKLKGFDKPISVFIQAKHRENDKLLTLTSKKDLANCFDSYLKIKRRFQPSNEDALFKGTFCETDCLFVMYTTAKDDGCSKPCEGSLVTYLNNTIGTGSPGSQPFYTDEDVDLLSKTVLEEQLTTLAQKMAKYMLDDAKNQMQIMNDELVIRHHVILAKYIFDISDIQPEGHRIASLRDDRFPFGVQVYSIEYDFFRQIMLFQDALCSEILERLKKLDGRRKRLPSQHFKVPAVFGNKDLAIRGNDGKIEKRLDYLCTKLTDLIKSSKPSKIVTIDESLEDGFLRLNGGIASAVGNIFVLDDTSKPSFHRVHHQFDLSADCSQGPSAGHEAFLRGKMRAVEPRYKLFKFCENSESLGYIAKWFFEKLQSKILHMQDYRFEIRGKMFPKLSFTRSEYDDHVVKDFFNKLVFYSSQGDENDVEDILKDEIQNSQAHNHNVEIRSEAIFLKYHDEVQKWWMIPKEGSYLTKGSELFKNAVDSTSQSLMGIINMTLKLKYKHYSFNEDAVNSLQLQDHSSRTVIITDNSAFTVAKLLRYMKNKDLVVLDLEYIVKLPAGDYNTFQFELTNANEAKTFIIVVDKIPILTPVTSKRLQNIALILNDKNCIIVAVYSFVEFVKTVFSLKDNVIKDERNNLTDLVKELQENVLENTKVIFQGNEVSIGDMLDNLTIINVGGQVLYQILNGERNFVGKSVVDSNFNITECVDTILAPVTVTMNITQDLPRYTTQVLKDQLFNFKTLPSLFQLTGYVTVIVANPGMGKTNFLSQVSTVLKKNHPTVWILRINLLEYARKFSEWQTNETVIDTLESLKFMCQVALSEERSRMNEVKIVLEEADGIVLKKCRGDEWTVFELKIFLHCYNIGKVLFLFDGFDEICPHYAPEVLTLIEVLKNHPMKHNIWITSRSYDKIVTNLQRLGKLYEIVPWSYEESFRFINMIWDSKKILKDLNTGQLNTVYKFIEFMATAIKTYKKEIAKKRNILQKRKKKIPFSTIYFWFIKYLKANLTSAPPDVMSSLNKLCVELDHGSENTDEFDASPLLLNLISDYLYNKIRESNESPNKWYIDTNIFKVYESVLQTNLNRRFQEKNKIDMYKPDNIIAYGKEYADCVAIHRKLAAYAIFHKHLDQLFNTFELNEINNFLEMLKRGLEKSGIICNVVNDRPIFVHSTFAEYFAVEFICDIIKAASCRIMFDFTNGANKRKIWHFILNEMFFKYNLDVLATLDAKIEIDKELTTIIEQKHNRVIFELLLEQSKNTEIKSSLCEAIRYNLRNLGKLLLSTIENNLDETNLMDFIKIVTETKLLMNAIKMEFEEIILTIVERVRVIDKFKLYVLFPNGLIENFDNVCNDEIIHELHKHVWARMDIIPNSTNLAELGDIHFI